LELDGIHYAGLESWYPCNTWQ